MVDYFDIGSERLHGTAASGRSAIEFSGLVGVPAPRRDAMNKPRADGAFEESSVIHLPARFVTVKGEVWGDPATEAVHDDFGLILKQLEASLSAGVLAKWRRENSTRVMRGLFRMAGEVLPDFSAEHLGRIEYMVTLRFADPRWYNDSESTATAAIGANASATNTGNTKTGARFVITGPITNPLITNNTTGEVISFVTGFALTAGQTLTVDTGAMTADRSGTNVLGSVKYSEAKFFTLPGGVTQSIKVTGTGTTGATTFNMFWRHAYWG